MSEYQYYEFAAIDRPLTDEETDELGKLSSRAEITATSFKNVYHYGDFRGNPRKMMEKYFDFFVYVANWGTYWCMVRVPKWALDPKQIKPYLDGEVVSLHEVGDYLIVEFEAREEEPGDWVEGEGYLQALRPVRDALMAGDLRPFYLGWLRAAMQGVADDEEEEPPVPPGLDKLPRALKTFADFLMIDVDLIAAAARSNTEAAAPEGPSRDDFAAWIRNYDDRVKNGWLLDLLEGEGAKARLQALTAFHQSRAKSAPPDKGQSSTPRRTAAELLAAAAPLREQRVAQETKRAADAKAAARNKHLDELAAREAAAWKEVDQLLATTKSTSHARAVELLGDLRDVAARSGRIDKAQDRIEQYRQRFTRRPALIRRFRQAGL